MADNSACRTVPCNVAVISDNVEDVYVVVMLGNWVDQWSDA